MEPARRIELRLHPYRGCVLPLPLGRHELGAQGSNLEVSAFKARRVCQFPTAHREPLPRVELGCRPYKGQMSAGPRGIVSSARLERALPATSTPCLLPLGYEDPEPPPGVEPGHPLYEGEAASRARRRSYPPWIRTRKALKLPAPSHRESLYGCGDSWRRSRRI